MWNTLTEAIIYGNCSIGMIKCLINQINTQTPSGATPLHLAVLDSNNKIINGLLLHGAEVNFKNEYGETALHWACKSGNIGAVELLIKYGININIQDNDGESALFWAVEYNNPMIVTLLLVHGALLFKNENFKNPLQIAKKYKSIECIPILKAYYKKPKLSFSIHF